MAMGTNRVRLIVQEAAYFLQALLRRAGFSPVVPASRPKLTGKRPRKQISGPLSLRRGGKLLLRP